MRYWIVCLGLLLSHLLSAQVMIPNYPDSIFSTYYHQRWSHFKTLPRTNGDIIFLGNSITDGAEWSELFRNTSIKNRGISGDISAGVLHRLNEVATRHPSKIFLLIGANDLARGTHTDSITKNIFLIVDYLHQYTPATRLYVQSLLPVNDTFHLFQGHTNKGDSIVRINSMLANLQIEHHFTYIPMHDFFCNGSGKMDTRYTNDGLHLKGDGYLLWKHLILPNIRDVAPKPSLLPLPQKIVWNDGFFPLYKCTSINFANDSLQKTATMISDFIQKNSFASDVKFNEAFASFPIELKITEKRVGIENDEGYHLAVRNDKIVIEAVTLHGLFNSVQTFKQLVRDELVDCCDIEDYPAYSWRGYMVDVGRNYQSMDLLKQQIDAMSDYKLNVFHFHTTEDIAWRIAVDGFPQLTVPNTMQRNPGAWYAKDDILELIQYCKDRFITFVPEIDMPGHAAAFERAMHVTMQSDSGMKIVTQILTNLCRQYPFEYIHIGGDEVKISNASFLSTMTALLNKLGKKTIGWSPGGNLDSSAIRQLWMGGENLLTRKGFLYIDSRHLYINHMDPFESVVTLFFRQLGSVTQGSAAVLGAELCLWHDRNVLREEDLLKQNPIYPAMLTFAERAWLGGGNSTWTATIGDSSSAGYTSFKQFETRLLDQKKQRFSAKPFPYVKQTNIIWNYYGPFLNKGNLSASFPIEQTKGEKEKTSFQSVGATQVLRHWWSPLVKGVLNTPVENTTWYATTQLWCDADTVMPFWIGFDNISRSYATDSPDKNTWDSRHSWIKVNGNLVAPPVWKHAGLKGDLSVPLVDEGYEYRSPTMIRLHSGWNHVMVKLPIGRFQANDFGNPVKWMFTFSEVEP